MADCGAGGSTLDRAARMIGGQEGSKHVASWLGHAAMNSSSGGGGVRAVLPMSTAPPMPVVAPDHIVIPAIRSSSSSTRARGSTIAVHVAPPGPSVQSDQAHSHPSVAAGQPLHSNNGFMRQPHLASPPPAPVHLSHHPMMHHPQQHMMMAHQHQHQMMMAAAAHQQQHMMMVQQQQQHAMWMQQQQQQQQQQLARMQQQKEAEAATVTSAHQQGQNLEDDVVTVGECEEEDAEVYDEGYNRGHEGEAHPVRIEDLAAAWAEAQAEYEELEAAVNLAAAHGYDVGEGTDSAAYEFVNRLTSKSEAEGASPALPDQHWMEEGMSHFAEGNLAEAIRAFEMELQVHGQDNASAWRMLGRCHAENDQDQAAIACLQQAVARDPTSPDARLALGVSQVNELHHSAALENLKAWITNNPKYAGVVHESPESLLGPSGEEIDSMEAAFNEVQRLLLQALSVQPDPDVLEALGVVYNVSRDYEGAVEAFTRAIALRPDSYQLYNRLGATLANSSQSDKALPMYRKALELRPKYARAWLNSAISFSNLQNYDDAARCYLQTLSLNPSALHCWSYLRIALSCSEKWDLIPFAAAMDLEAFKDHYDFVLYQA